MTGLLLNFNTSDTALMGNIAVQPLPRLSDTFRLAIVDPVVSSISLVSVPVNNVWASLVPPTPSSLLSSIAFQSNVSRLQNQNPLPVIIPLPIPVFYPPSPPVAPSYQTNPSVNRINSVKLPIMDLGVLFVQQFLRPLS